MESKQLIRNNLFIELFDCFLNTITKQEFETTRA